MTINLIDQIYEKDPESGKYIIHVVLNNYQEVYNEMDPAPFRKKDLNSFLRSFLESCSSDIPLNFDIQLDFEFKRETMNEEKEEKIRDGIKNFFLLLIYNQRKERNKTLQRAVVFTIVSFIALAVGFYLRSFDTKDWVHVTITEGFYIGGWVFFWEALSMLTFQNRGKRIKQKEYKRLMTANVLFHY